MRIVGWLTLLALVPSVRAAERVEILRDEYGVPHIFAATAAGAAYASGYAQATDRRDQLMRHLANSTPSSEAALAQLPQNLQAILAAYCAGLAAGGVREIQPSMVFDYSRHFSVSGTTWPIPPERTASNAPILILDPAVSFDDDWYQMIVSAGDYNWAGSGPAGLPFPLIGHGFKSAIGPADLQPNDRLLEQVWAMQSGEHEPLPSVNSDSQAAAMTRAQLEFAMRLTIYEALKIATSTEVYHAEAWLKRIAQVDPDSAFSRMISGWSRRADFNSGPTLAYYLFKMALDEDANALEPPASLSDSRIHSALRKAQQRYETEFSFQAAFGSVFKIAGQPASGGTLTEAAMATPRAIRYEKRGSNMTGVSGPVATQIVEMIRPVPKSYMLIPLEGSPASFAQGDVQPTYFGDRKELEKHVRSRKQLTAP